MEWYKHSTGSHDDPDISDAWDELGEFGYLGFFVILEIYGQEYSHRDSENYINISQTFLRRKLRKSWTNVRLLLDFYLKRNRIVSKISENNIMLMIPKFIDVASNWTKRVPTEVSTDAPTAKEGEEDKEEKKKKKIPPLVPPQPPADEPAIFINLPLNDKSEYPVTVTVIADMNTLFPAVDVEQEFRGMRAWCLANPTKLKTRTGIKKFYTTWLSDKQNKSARVIVAPIKPEPEPATPAVPKVIPKTDDKLHARFYTKVILPMRDEMQEGSWCAFIEPLRVVLFDKATNQITLYADTNVKAWVEDHYLSEIVALAGCQVRIIDGDDE